MDECLMFMKPRVDGADESSSYRSYEVEAAMRLEAITTSNKKLQTSQRKQKRSDPSSYRGSWEPLECRCLTLGIIVYMVCQVYHIHPYIDWWFTTCGTPSNQPRPLPRPLSFRVPR